MVSFGHVTHTLHQTLSIPSDMDMVIHAGDCSNYADPRLNEYEVNTFMQWYSSLDIPYKIYSPGNHDTSIEKGMIKVPENVTCLIHNEIIIDGLKIFCSPYTPTFGVNWAWNKSREKIYKVWDSIPDDTDILVTHGPSYSALDVSEKRDHEIEFCGCKNLDKRISKIKPKVHIFGHIHGNRKFENSGILFRDNIYRINASCANDENYDFLPHQGFIFDIIDGKITNIMENYAQS